MVLCLKELGGSMVNSIFHLSEVDQMNIGTPGDLVVKSTPLHLSGSVALKHLNLIHKKELLSFSFFKKVKVLHKYLYVETLIL